MIGIERTKKKKTVQVLTYRLQLSSCVGWIDKVFSPPFLFCFLFFEMAMDKVNFNQHHNRWPWTITLRFFISPLTLKFIFLYTRWQHKQSFKDFELKIAVGGFKLPSLLFRHDDLTNPCFSPSSFHKYHTIQHISRLYTAHPSRKVRIISLPLLSFQYFCAFFVDQGMLFFLLSLQRRFLFFIFSFPFFWFFANTHRSNFLILFVFVDITVHFIMLCLFLGSCAQAQIPNLFFFFFGWEKLWF